VSGKCRAFGILKRRWQLPTLLLLVASLSLGAATAQKADRLVVEKAARRLMLFHKGQVLATYHVALGRQPRGAKQCQGDNRTPEGLYVIDSRNAQSRYHRSLHVSYPNRADLAAAKAKGCRPGGDIMIHGLPNGYRWTGPGRPGDWTLGCIAVLDDEIEEIWRLVPNGTPIEIKP
jgi:murein L,D-transpeptidase YafK